jgi:NAD(P)-dependent dehydrogenase (short-subunit alcohol dehydrogenase family)
MPSSPVALITGCSTGIGYEAALRLARKGTMVFAGFRDLTKAGPLKKAAQGLDLYFLQLDVDKPASVRRAVAKVIAQAGQIDLLINNAGYGAFGALEDFTDAEIKAQYQTNVLGLMRVTREVLPFMRARRSGRIIHIGSLAGKMTFAGIALYCSSKHAVEALTESLRMEVRPFGVQVAVVEPGSMNTAFKANRRKSGVFQKGKSAYQGRLQKILDFGNDQSARAPGASKVVEVLEKAIEDKVMKTRYPVGFDSFVYPRIRWWVPESFWDLLMRRVGRKFKAASALEKPQPKGTAFTGARVALVTGATSGFGLETVRLLAQKGFRVYGTYRDPRKLDSLRALARENPGVFPLFMDVTRSATVAQAVARLIQKEKRLDLLVNNAGFVMAGFLEELSEEEFAAQFDTNVFGLLRVTRAVLPLMRQQGTGTVVNVGSISGRASFPGLGAYAASKFAVRSISEGLRQETRPFGVQVCEIAPGSYGTQVLKSTRYGTKVKSPGSAYTPFTVQMEALVKKEFAKGRNPKEVAELILRSARSRTPRPVYLAGPDAKFMNFMKWFLPDSAYEWFLKRAFPWSRFPEKTDKKYLEQ